MGAIAAGCPAVVKPSDLTIHTSSLICNLVRKYLDPDCFRVVMGGVEQATRLLELKWSSSECLVYNCGRSETNAVSSMLYRRHTGRKDRRRGCCQTNDSGNSRSEHTYPIRLFQSYLSDNF